MSRSRSTVSLPLTVLVGTALIVVMQVYVAIPLTPIIAADLGTGAVAASLGTAYSLAYAAGFLFWGPLSDRFGRKAVLVPGLATLAVATLGVAAASSLVMLAFLRAAQGLVAASFPAPALAYVGESLPPRWRATSVGAISTAFLVSGIVGQIYAQAVEAALGWRWVFVLASPLFALAALAMSRVLIQPDLERASSPLSQKYRELGRLAKRREFSWVYLASFGALLSFVAMYGALGPMIQARFGAAGSDVLLVRLAALPAMLLAPVAGWLAGRFGTARVTVIGFLLAAAGLTAEALAANTLSLLVIASVVYVAGIATLVPAIIALVGGRAETAKGGAIGMLGFALFAGASIGALAPDVPIGFSQLLLALACLLVLGSLLVAFSGPKRKPDSVAL